MADSHNGKLPKGWRMVRFGDVVRDVNEAERNPLGAGLERYVGLEHIEPENLHLRAWGDLTTDEVSFTKRFRKRQVLFGKRRAYQRKVAVAEFDGICSSDILTFEPKDDALLPELLPFLVQSEGFFEHALGTSSGSLSPRTRWSQLQDYQFPLPPKDEQQRIAEILWAADECVQSWRQIKRSLDSAKRMVVAEMFRNGLRNEPKKRTTMGLVPESWNVVRLEQAVEFLDGRRIPLKDADRAKRKGPYPYYGASGIIDHIDDYIFDEPIILLSEDGFNLIHRNSPIAFRVDGKCWVNNHAHVLKPSSRIDIDLLVEYLESLSLVPYITGTYQRKLNKSACEGIPVPLPCPDEQNLMLQILKSFEESRVNSDMHADQCCALFVEVAESLLGGGNVH